MNRIIRAFAAFIVSICLILAPPMAYANTSVGGWSAVDTVIAGATTTINATKTAGGKVLQSAVTVAPSAAKVGKYLIRGGGAAALALAVPQLLGDAVDWVLDPANNAVKYTIPASVGVGSYTVNGKKSSTMIGACDAFRQSFNASMGFEHYLAPSVEGNPEPGGQFFCIFPKKNGGADARVQGWAGESVTNPEQNKSIPIDTVAAQVISNAETGDPSSQEAVKATALEGFAAGEHDAALEAAATESEAGTENPPDTTDPDNPAEPSEPFDPAGIISAINALKALLAGILSSISSMADALSGFFDWAMADPQIEEPDMTPPEVEDITKYDTIDLNQGYVTASGQCPSAVDLNINFGVIQLSYEPLCLILEKLSGVIVAVAYISVGFMIIRTV